MNKLIFVSLTFQLLSFQLISQINMFDENGQKHGEWVENGKNFIYYHGKPTGKVIESGGYVVYDSIGEIMQRVAYFQERPSEIMTEEYFEFGKSKLFKRYKINPTTNKPYLIKQESFKITKKPNGYVERKFDGLQIRYGGNITIYPMGQRVEDTFENGVLIKKTLYYPDGINKLDEISFVPTGIEEYPYVQSLYTMYYKNGQKLIEFDVRHFFDQLIDKGPLNGNLKYEGNSIAELINMVGYYCPEMKDYETSNSAGNSFQAGFKSYREPKNFFSEDTLTIPIYFENGTIIKTMVYVKTNLVND